MPKACLRFLFADQLSHRISALEDIDSDRDVVLLVEVEDEANLVGHHRKKLAFLFAAMRHFARELRDRGIEVDYVALDDPQNTQNFQNELARAKRRHRPRKTVVTEPGEYRVEELLKDHVDEIRVDTRFLCSKEDFSNWAAGRKALRMEHFYRWMRQRHDILMAGRDPIGGQWNFDKDNRKPPKQGLDFPQPSRFAPDETTQAVLALVEAKFPNRFGDLTPFWFATSAEQARQALAHFIETALPWFGDYQDAMLADEDYLFHSALSQYLNCGLLAPQEVIEAAIDAYVSGHAPINAVEGFVRQILGWREYVRGLYWQFMPDYAEMNALGADRSLPPLYWDGDTDMACVAKAVDQTRREAHSHHIQRLMVTGNLALLIGVMPKELCDWYLAVYADAFDWVELPNTLGMVAYADDGLMASKPYAASGAYINRMSDFCRHCRYDVKRKRGDEACPFNYLYWNFLIRHRERFERNRRMGMILKNIESMDPSALEQIRQDSERFIASLYDNSAENEGQ